MYGQILSRVRVHVARFTKPVPGRDTIRTVVGEVLISGHMLGFQARRRIQCVDSGAAPEQRFLRALRW